MMYLLIEQDTGLHYEGAEVTKVEARRWSNRYLQVDAFYLRPGASRRTKVEVDSGDFTRFKPEIRRVLRAML